MKQFLINLAKFLPIVMIVAAINVIVDPANIYVMGYEEEMADLLLAGKNVAAMTNYDERILQEKIIQREKICPKTIILGSSRVMIISDESVNMENYRNHGMSGAGIWDYIGILGIYESNGKMPEQIIMGLDPWILNENNGDARYQSLAAYIDEFMKAMEGTEIQQKKIKNLPSLEKSLQLFSFPYFQNSIKNLLKNPKKALKLDGNKEFYGTEKRNVEEAIYYTDGSMESNRVYRERSIETVNADAMGYVTGKVYQLENYDSLSGTNCGMMERTIEYLQNKEVQVTFYLPPYHPIVYEYLKNNERYEMILSAETYFRNLAIEKEIDVYGSYDPQILGCTEEDFLDGMHMKREKMSDSWKKVF